MADSPFCYEKFSRTTEKERKESLRFFKEVFGYIFMQLLMRHSAPSPIVQAV